MAKKSRARIGSPPRASSPLVQVALRPEVKAAMIAEARLFGAGLMSYASRVLEGLDPATRAAAFQRGQSAQDRAVARGLRAVGHALGSEAEGGGA